MLFTNFISFYVGIFLLLHVCVWCDRKSRWWRWRCWHGVTVGSWHTTRPVVSQPRNRVVTTSSPSRLCQSIRPCSRRGRPRVNSLVPPDHMATHLNLRLAARLTPSFWYLFLFLFSSQFKGWCWVMLIVWRLKGNIIRTAPCWVVWQCSQSAAHSCEQFLEVQQIGFVILGPLRHASRRLPRVVLL